MKRSASTLLVAFFLSLGASSPALAANLRIEKLKETVSEFQDALKQKDYQRSELFLKRANRIIERAKDQGDGEFFLEPDCDALRQQVEALTTNFRFERACEDFFSALEQLKTSPSLDVIDSLSGKLKQGASELLRLRNNGFDLYAERVLSNGKRVRGVDVLEGCRAKLSELAQTPD